MAVERDYVLGTHDEEISRLALQHRVWRPRATAAWRRAGFSVGHTLIDLGCGPGNASIDLAEIAGPSGRVFALDRSRRFLDVLSAKAQRLGLGQIETVELDLDRDELPAIEADGIWSRWIYAFVRDPRGLLARAASRLRKGGTMAIHEYVDYRGWRLSPRSAEFEGFVSEVIESWRDSGGEPDIGMDLPRWLGELGLEIRSLRPIVEIARPGDFVWQWPRAFIQSGVRRLVDLGRIDEARAGAIVAAYESVEATPHAFQLTPSVVEIIARRV